MASAATSKGYSSILTEEIALEGLDGITLEVLWVRLNNNPNWSLKPTDNYVKEFVWKQLITLPDVRWYELPEPRECPLIFSHIEEFINAVSSQKIDPFTYSATCYPHSFVKDVDIIGSCPTYHERVEVSEEISKLSRSETEDKWGNRLVLVANQNIRNFVLLGTTMNPEIEIPDISYCILERIGRSRWCGEVSVGLNFLRNGANPTFYFWNKLKKYKLITSQYIYISGKLSNSTLFYLPKYFQNYTSELINSVYCAVKFIKTKPEKKCLYSEVKAVLPQQKCKVPKSELFRRYIRIESMNYDEFYPNSAPSERYTKNGSVKVIKLATLVNKNVEPETILQQDVDLDRGKEHSGILQGKRLYNRPLISQCFNYVNSSGVEGISLLDLCNHLGLNKLGSRHFIKLLQRKDLINGLAFDSGRQKYYRYFSKDNWIKVKQKYNAEFNKEVSALQNGTVKDSMMDDSFSNEMEESSMEVDKSEVQEVPETTNKSQRTMSLQNSEATSSNQRKRKLPSAAENKNEPATKKQRETPISPTTDKSAEQSSVAPITLITVPTADTVSYMRRTNIILEYVYKKRVVTSIDILKFVKEEEAKLGISRGTPCRKSILRIVNMLTEKEKVKQIKKIVKDDYLKKSREMKFVCSPNVTEDDPLLQAHVEQKQKDVSILYLRPNNLSTISKDKLKEIDMQLVPLVKTKENAIKYEFAPKFARMRILHEFLVYIVYNYKGNENGDTKENEEYIKNFCPDLNSEEIPLCYLKEISWKMFIPPLVKYEEYGTSWVSQNDIIERLPIKLLCSLSRFSYYVPALDEYLTHPVKQFYLIRHLPTELQKILTCDKRHIFSLNKDLRNLCLIGLIQFGPKSIIHGDQPLVYLNQQSQLLDTRTCPPTYLQINPDLNYPKHQYNFREENGTESYWNDSCKFCVGTRLRQKSALKRKKNEVKPELAEYFKARLIEDAASFDTSHIPGDRLGAAGYDSSLLSHLMKQWFVSSTEKTIAVSQANRNIQVQKRVKSAAQLKRIRFNLQKKAKQRVVKKPHPYDKVDVEALSKLKTLRATWSKEEDEILFMCYLANKYYTHKILEAFNPQQVFRKILHEKSAISFSKTTISCKRRVYNLMKNPARKHSANLYLKDIADDVDMKNQFQDTIDKMEMLAKEKNTTKLNSMYSTFIEQVFNYMYEHSKQKIATRLKGAFSSKLPDNIEQLRESFTIEYPHLLNMKKIHFPQPKEREISTIIIINLIYSTLFSQVDKSKVLNISHLYKIFKKFDDSQLKLALSFVRNNRLISFNRYGERQKCSMLPIGKGTYHFSITFHSILKSMYSPKIFNHVYSRYLEILARFNAENAELRDSDIGVALIMCSYFTNNLVSFHITVPETIMEFNNKPLPRIDPENVIKPIFAAKEQYTDSTLSLIRETFFKKDAEKSNADELLEDKPNENVTYGSLSDSDSEDEDSSFESCILEEKYGRRSKLAVFVTRSQFKRSYLRFSNAYDHFLINKFMVKYNVDTLKLCPDVEDDFYPNYWLKIERSCIYKSVKFDTNQIANKIKKYFSNSVERDLATHLLEFVKSKGVNGVDRVTLLDEFKDLQLLKTVLYILCARKLVIRCGSDDVNYVHLDFYRSWLIPCVKNGDLFEDKNSSSSPTKHIDESINVGANEDTWMLPQPWIQVNGTVNRLALQSLIVRILTYIVKKPGISLHDLLHKFSPALFPYWVFEITEILEELGVIKLNVLHKLNKVTLFSKKVENKVTEEATRFEDRRSIFIEPDVNALVKCSLFFANAKQTDLLEMKYALDVSSSAEPPVEVEKQEVSQN